MNDQTQAYKIGTEAMTLSLEHVVYLRDFDRVQTIAEKKMTGQDGETKFREVADRVRKWMKKNRHQATRVLKEADTAYTKKNVVTMLAA